MTSIGQCSFRPTCLPDSNFGSHWWSRTVQRMRASRRLQPDLCAVHLTYKYGMLSTYRCAGFKIVLKQSSFLAGLAGGSLISVNFTDEAP